MNNDYKQYLITDGETVRLSNEAPVYLKEDFKRQLGEFCGIFDLIDFVLQEELSKANY